jgi:class 3 adenylate cyclase
MDVVAWLRGLGLEQYAPAFRAKDVDGEVLPELTADDLISIGVTSVGHRRKLLAAIAALRAEPRHDLAQPAVSATSAPVSPPTIEAERRQLTVMFCDLVGSTALSTGMDPEDLRDVIASYQSRCSAATRHYDGFVAKYMGDGILVFFGYPRAHEDEAERSVRAGLDIVEVMAELNAAVLRPPGVELAVRIGIATGPVIVSDQIGEGTASETAVVGEDAEPGGAACRPWRNRTRSSSARPRARCSAITSTLRIWEHLG